LDQLRQLAQSLQCYRQYLLCSGAPPLSNVSLPESIYQGWILLVLAMMHSTARGSKFRNLLARATSSTLRGVNDLCKGLSEHSLTGKSVVLPLDLASLMVLNLTNDVAKEEQRHLTTKYVYNEMVQSLVSHLVYPEQMGML
jgi:hypothetical protein